MQKVVIYLFLEWFEKQSILKNIITEKIMMDRLCSFYLENNEVNNIFQSAQ